MFITVLSLFSFSGASADKTPQISARSAVLMHEGRPLYEKRAHERLPMASTTKLMTAILAIENAKPQDAVKILPEYCMVEGSSMYLKPDTERTVEELLKGLLLVSGNDAALALAHHISGSVEAFTALMNTKAKELGMQDTHFQNPHGLSHEDHYSSAYDLALLMEYCMENETFSRIAAMKSFENDGAVLLNHNKLLFICKGCEGGKTGYTMAAGRCLVSCCRREGVSIVCVTLSAPEDWNDHMALYDWCYSTHSPRCLTENQRLSVSLASADDEEAYLVPEKEHHAFVSDASEIRLDIRLPWLVFKPVRQGDAGAKVSIFVDGVEYGEYYLIYDKDYF